MSTNEIKKLENQMTTIMEKLKEAKRQPTGLFCTIIKDTEGNIIHSFEDRKKEDAIKLRNYFYKVLVMKLKQKTSITVRPQYKAG